MALRVPEMCFWPAKTRKNLELFEMHTCLWPGAQLWFWNKWRKLVTASLLLQCIDDYSCLQYWNELFSAVFQVLDWSFLVSHFDGNVCNWIPKVIWPRKDWFWVFFLLGTGFFRPFHICMDWSLQELLNCCSFFDDIQFFRCLVWGVFWSVHEKMLVIFSHMILWYRLISFRKAMQLQLLSVFVFDPFFLGSSGKCLWLLLKTK